MPVHANPVRTRRLRRAERRACPAVGAIDASGQCPLLAQLVHPLSPSSFFQRHWRQRALAVHGGRRRFAALIRDRLHGLALRRLVADSPSEEIHVWFRTAAGANESMKTADRAAALTCHGAGGSLYFRAPEVASELLVTALSQQLGLSFGALYPDGAPRSEVETFVSRPGHVTDWHFDFMENFTLQLKGTKRWKLKASSVEVPVRGCTPQWGRSSVDVRGAAEQQAKVHTQHARGDGGGAFDAAPPASFFDDATQVTLRPGSMLYVPAGMWHRVECDEESVSINVSLMGALWADVVADALRQRLLCHAAARAPVCMRSVADGRRQLASVLALAQRELESLPPACLLPGAIALPRVARRPLPPTEAEAEAGAGGQAVPGVTRGVRVVKGGARFARSPLAVVVRLANQEEEEEEEEGDDDDGEGEGSAASGGAEEEGKAEEEEEEAMEAEDGGQAQRSGAARCGGGGRLVSSSDVLLDLGRGELDGGEEGATRTDGARYALHSHFGGEELGSMLRVELCVATRLVPLLEWCRAAPARFSARQALQAARAGAAGPAPSADEVYRTLGVLEWHGFCVRDKKRPAPREAS